MGGRKHLGGALEIVVVVDCRFEDCISRDMSEI